MKKLFFISCLMFCAVTQAYTQPKLPKLGKSINAFVPQGWFILKQSDGDLNADNISDIAIILADSNEEEAEFADEARSLVILLKKPDGSYELAANESKWIMRKSEGGMLGDPLWEFKIERGALMIKFYGGSSERWGMTYRFRLQNNDWYLIGYTSLSANNIELTNHTTDVNWNTGDIIITNTKGEKSTEKKLKKKLSPIKLKNFDPAQCDKALGI